MRTTLSRREFVKTSMIFTAGAPLIPSFAKKMIPESSMQLHWLDNKAPAFSAGATWGVPWPKGTKNTGFILENDKGEHINVQSWPLAFWPDGTVKWTAHAIAANKGLSDKLILKTGKTSNTGSIKVKETADQISIDNGIIQCVINKSGSPLIRSIIRDGKETAKDGKLVLFIQDAEEQNHEWFSGD